MLRYGIFRYVNFPKRTDKDVRIKVYQSSKQTILEAIKFNKEAGLKGNRYYWRELEDTEV